MIEREDPEGLTLAAVAEVLAVAREIGAADDEIVLGQTDEHGRLVRVRVETDGGDVPETDKIDKIDKLSRLHAALTHDGPADACPEAACRRIRLEQSGVQVGREDKTHPAGKDSERP